MRRGLTEEQVKTAVERVRAGGNPYISKSIQFFIDRKPVYLYANEIMTEEQLLEEYIKTAKHDILAGYKDRMSGYYDKWYRYSHADEGRAYDEGVKLATSEPDCPEEFHIIECS